jgi:hypothetical protein
VAGSKDMVVILAGLGAAAETLEAVGEIFLVKPLQYISRIIVLWIIEISYI